MRRPVTAAAALAALLLASFLPGCDQLGGGTAASNDPPPPLRPFYGEWKFDPTKTLAQWKADGVPAGPAAPTHPDLSIDGYVARLGGLPEGEYTFYGLHTHGGTTCGKAWHQEDRHDPGDASKCYARLRLAAGGKELHLSLRVDASGMNPSDPDLASVPPTEAPAGSCTADSAPAPPWSPWRTYVFVSG